MDADVTHMQRALELAGNGQGHVEPNPMVGAVIVRHGQMIGEGWHRAFGRSHAEVEALADAKQRGHDAGGACMYVTLEPCCHHGKTGPCTQAVIEAGVGRVVVAMKDPFDKVAGQGIAQLKAAGLDVTVGVLEGQARQLNEPFIKRVTTGLPWVIAKWAQTVDGYIATASGDSQWISNEQSRLVVHATRARVDAILVGIGTALADDPSLTARDVAVKRTALRVVLDPQVKLPTEAKLVRTAGQTPVLLAVSEEALAAGGEKIEALRAAGVSLLGLPMATGEFASPRLAIEPLLRHLVNEHGATNVLVEGGGRLIGSLLQQDLLDQAMVFVAPKVLGDAAGRPAVHGLLAPTMHAARQLTLRRTQRLGDDMLLDYSLPPRSNGV